MVSVEVKKYSHKCDFCDKTIVNNTKDSPYKALWYVWYGGYGDQERMSERRDACDKCFEEQKEKYKQESLCVGCGKKFPYYSDERETGLRRIYLFPHGTSVNRCQSCIDKLVEGVDYYWPTKWR